MLDHLTQSLARHPALYILVGYAGGMLTGLIIGVATMGYVTLMILGGKEVQDLNSD
jgi:ABC-type nitrate/sulfonate/bicarbonate transport system permease component